MNLTMAILPYLGATQSRRRHVYMVVQTRGGSVLEVGVAGVDVGVAGGSVGASSLTRLCG